MALVRSQERRWAQQIVWRPWRTRICCTCAVAFIWAHEDLRYYRRSLLPNFNLQGEALPEGENAGAAQDLNRGVNRLMAAMRDMLANIQFQEPPREDNPDEEVDGEWD
ncbi:hypothetical protein AB205_0203430 [Aquarana catesbeiana]|uniref:Uncharacterized protein n=1 Tax=Aquarana catesbeiana TaxID=8400 RepID=A0A2G9QCX5_AQUCT|nr:hypothetical protein AB205_0203430 [Aquarana catesbeiana]